MTPSSSGITHTLGGDSLQWCTAVIQLDDEGDLARQSRSLGAYLLHDLQKTQPLVSTKQNRQWAQLSGNRSDLLKADFGLQHCVRQSREQSQVLVIAQRVQVGGPRC